MSLGSTLCLLERAVLENCQKHVPVLEGGEITTIGGVSSRFSVEHKPLQPRENAHTAPVYRSLPWVACIVVANNVVLLQRCKIDTVGRKEVHRTELGGQCPSWSDSGHPAVAWLSDRQARTDRKVRHNRTTRKAWWKGLKNEARILYDREAQRQKRPRGL